MTPEQAHYIAATVYDNSIYYAASRLLNALEASETTEGMVRYVEVQGDRLAFMTVVLLWDRENPTFRSTTDYSEYLDFYRRRFQGKFVNILPKLGRERIEPVMMSIRKDIEGCLNAVGKAKLALLANKRHPMSAIFEEVDTALPISGMMAPKVRHRDSQLEATYGAMFRKSVEAIRAA